MSRETRVAVPAIFTLTGGHCSIFLNVKRDVATCFPESPPGASAGLSVRPPMRRRDGTLSPPRLIDTTISVSRIWGGEKKNQCVPLPEDVFDELRSFGLLVCWCWFTRHVLHLVSCLSGTNAKAVVLNHIPLSGHTFFCGARILRQVVLLQIGILHRLHMLTASSSTTFFNGKFQTDLTLEPNTHDSLNTWVKMCHRSSEHVS